MTRGIGFITDTIGMTRGIGFVNIGMTRGIGITRGIGGSKLYNERRRKCIDLLLTAAPNAARSSTGINIVASLSFRT